MDFDELDEQLESNQLASLHLILAARLKLNRTWGNVKTVIGKKYIKIIWFEPKTPTDLHKVRDVTPKTLHTLNKQIEIQREKLTRDGRDYIASLR